MSPTTAIAERLGSLEWLTLLAVTSISSACASAGSTLGSGVGDTLVERPPYYAGAKAGRLASEVGSVGHIPIAYQRGAAQAPIFDPAVTAEMEALLADMNAYLDSLPLTRPLVEGGGVSAVTHAATRYPPDVRFGCLTDAGSPDDECAVDGNDVLGRDDHRMLLAVGRPSPEWVAWAQQIMKDGEVDYTLVITLEVGQYLVRQRGLSGRKEVEMGTSHVVPLPWLTSLETPVTVLQLTGALVGQDGKALRIGAEGLIARRTSMKLAAFGAQELITDGDVQELRTARRDDLAGAPLVWQAGLRTLVSLLVRGGAEAS